MDEHATHRGPVAGIRRTLTLDPLLVRLQCHRVGTLQCPLPEQVDPITHRLTRRSHRVVRSVKRPSAVVLTRTAWPPCQNRADSTRNTLRWLRAATEQRAPLQPSFPRPGTERPCVISVNGIVVDVRSMPREFQDEAYRLGLIPFVPAGAGP